MNPAGKCTTSITFSAGVQNGASSKNAGPDVNVD